ncbi:MAG: AraC family transcriptional regulator ligand-binding domain-containing protein [Pseudomonadota bacterium]
MVSTLVAYAMSRGFTLEEVEALTGIRGDGLFEPEKRLPENGVPNLLLALKERNPGLALSIDFAKSAPLSGVLSMAYSARYGKDLRHAIELVVRNRRYLSDQLSLRLVESADEAAMVASHPNDVIDYGLMSQAGMGVFRRGLRDVLEVDVQPLRIEFASTATGKAAEYEAFFGAPVHFGQSRSAFVMARHHLDIEMESANAQLYAFAEIYYRKVTEQSCFAKYPPQLLGLARAIAENAAEGEFGVAAAARVAQMSVRSAQRIAAQNGTTLQDIIKDVRAMRAKEFLADLNISVQEIAFLSGYTDDRAFRRAFRGWTGQSPTEYRRDLAGR